MTKSNLRSSSVLSYIKLALATTIWGGALSAGRIVGTTVPPFTTSCIRFIIALVIMAPSLYLTEKEFPRPTKKEFLIILLLSVAGMGMFNVLLFTALKTTTAIRSSIMLAFTPVIVTVAAFFIYKEKINIVMGIGIVLSTIGAVLTITRGDLASVLFEGLAVGDIYMICAVICWAGYSLIIKKAVSRLSPLAVLTYASVIGVILLLPFTFFEGGWQTLAHLDLKLTASLLYLGLFAAGFSYLWYFQGIKKVGSSVSSVFLNLEPVAAITIGILLLGEQLTVPLAAGALLVISGLFLTAYRKKK